MQALVPGDELVGEGKSRHEAPFLQPENGTEAASDDVNDENGCVLSLGFKEYPWKIKVAKTHASIKIP